MTQHSAPQKEWRKQRTSAELILPQKESKHTGSIKIYNKTVRYKISSQEIFRLEEISYAGMYVIVIGWMDRKSS